MGYREGMKIVGVCKVEPTDTITAPKHLSLTFFDLLFLRFPSIKRVYFFNTQSSDVIPRLKRSLSLALSHFLPLAGNLVWPESSTVPFVQYLEGDGVSFTVVEAGPDDLDFEILSDIDEASETEAYLALLPDCAVSNEKATVMAVQVTLFPGQGFSIGVTFRHVVLDGKSLHMLVKSWAYICRSLDSTKSSYALPYELTPSYDRTAIQDLGGYKEIYGKNWMSFDGPENRSLTPMEQNHNPDSVRRTFTFSRPEIEKIRLTMASQTSVFDRTSTFSIACAYVLVCLAKSNGVTDSDESSAMLTIACDCRARLDPPLPPNYFGNCITGTMAVAKEKDLAADWREGFGSALKPIVEVIRHFDREYGVLKEAEDWVQKWVSFVPSDPGDKFYSVAGSPRFEAYAADFGWGRPRKTDVISSGAIVMQDARDVDGIEFGLALEKPHMEAFASHFRQGLES